MRYLITTLLFITTALADPFCASVKKCNKGVCKIGGNNNSLSYINGSNANVYINPLTGKVSDFPELQIRAQLKARIAVEKAVSGASYTEQCLRQQGIVLD